MYNGSPAMAGYMGRIKCKVSGSPKDSCRAGINARVVSDSLSIAAMQGACGTHAASDYLATACVSLLTRPMRATLTFLL